MGIFTLLMNNEHCTPKTVAEGENGHKRRVVKGERPLGHDSSRSPDISFGGMVSLLLAPCGSGRLHASSPTARR